MLMPSFRSRTLSQIKNVSKHFYMCFDTFFLYWSNLKYLIDINTTIAIGEAGGNRVLNKMNIKFHHHL